ncbi:NACHT domain-containing protein, partial [bacterium]|nr:NACHT domain-containing protein [bacterium]
MESKPSSNVATPARKPASDLPKSQGHEAEIKRWMLNQSERCHLSGDMFPLQSILIKPRLLANIITPGLDDPQQYIPVLYQTLPRLFDAPELLAGMPYPTLSLEKALIGMRRILVTGHAGTGKTTTLADLVSRICQRDPSVGSLVASLPIFIHCRDLVLSLPQHGDVLSPLAHSVAILLKHHEEKPVFDSIFSAAKEGNLVLFLDGLEEVLPDYKGQVIHWIQNLLTV